jgi:hypothetical protein
MLPSIGGGARRAVDPAGRTPHYLAGTASAPVRMEILLKLISIINRKLLLKNNFNGPTL